MTAGTGSNTFRAGIDVVASTAPLWTPPTARGPLGPVIVRQEAEHVFVRRPARRLGCRTCGAAKSHRRHLGAPPSMNAFGSGDPRAYYPKKQLWQEMLVELLAAARLPKPLGFVLAEGRVGFPNRIKRDQGNFRVLLEKALGDALQAGGWLANDDWDSYEFGNLAYVYDKGRSWTQLVLLPQWPEEDAQASLLPG